MTNETVPRPIENPEYPIIVQIEPEGGFYCADCPVGDPQVRDHPEDHYRDMHGVAADMLMILTPEDA